MPSSFHPNEAGYRSMPPSGSKMDQALGSSCESRTKELAYRNETCRESSTAFIPKIRLKQVPVWVCLIANSRRSPRREYLGGKPQTRRLLRIGASADASLGNR